MAVACEPACTAVASSIQDASEMPDTYGVPFDTVRGFVCGGWGDVAPPDISDQNASNADGGNNFQESDQYFGYKKAPAGGDEHGEEDGAEWDDDDKAGG